MSTADSFHASRDRCDDRDCPDGLELGRGQTLGAVSWASATPTFTDGMLYIVGDRGEVGLVRPNPQRLEIVSQFQLPIAGKDEVRAGPAV